jgi:glutamate N-acetyltransferase/amino-acid N-acetyltransferase
VCSTGVIGVKLPMDKVRAGIDAAVAELSSDVEAGRRFLAAIQTTDAFPKEYWAGAGEARVAGVCKGAGMITPTWPPCWPSWPPTRPPPPRPCRAASPTSRRAASTPCTSTRTPSTNDTLMLLATGRRPRPAAAALEQALQAVAYRLAWLIARDGEGATKVTVVHVTGASSDAPADKIAAWWPLSALVRTALYGNDPNWGRFVSQVGNSPEVRQPHGWCAAAGRGGIPHGEPTPFDRAALSEAMRREDVRLELALAEGDGRGLLLTSDLGYRYVEVNAEYTT